MKNVKTAKLAFSALTGIAALVLAFESYRHSKEGMQQALQLANAPSSQIITVEQRLPYYGDCAHCIKDTVYGGASGLGAVGLGIASVALYRLSKNE